MPCSFQQYTHNRRSRTCAARSVASLLMEACRRALLYRMQNGSRAPLTRAWLGLGTLSLYKQGISNGFFIYAHPSHKRVANWFFGTRRCIICVRRILTRFPDLTVADYWNAYAGHSSKAYDFALSILPVSVFGRTPWSNPTPRRSSKPKARTRTPRSSRSTSRRSAS